MQNQTMSIDLAKLAVYLLKRIWLIIICAAIGFGFMYYTQTRNRVDYYAASGTMYVYNGNPNVVNYQYVSMSDLNSAVQLMDTYMVVVKSNKVMDSVTDRLAAAYPQITSDYIRGTLSMGSVSETGVMKVTCTTNNAQLSADICNAVLDVAPAEIIRVVSAGSAEVIDYAEAPSFPIPVNPMKKGLIGGMAGAVAAGGLLLLLFLLNRKVTSVKDIENSFTPPVLAEIKREKKDAKKPSAFLLNEDSPFEKTEGYAKLRMNLMYTLVGKKNNIVVVTSAISGDGKSTIAANLAISCAMGGKKTLLIDADMRRACQPDILGYGRRLRGLFDVLVGEKTWDECLVMSKHENLHILPAGHIPPNPAELLGSAQMKELLDKLSAEYDLILMDMPPINIVSDPLVLSEHVAGCLFAVRQHYSDQRDIRNALISAEMTSMDVLGFVYYGEKTGHSHYYNKKYYNGYENRGKTKKDK